MRVLYVDIDSLRPDHLGCYGYERDTSPTVDAVADEGVAFTECYTSDSPCLPSRTALATARHGIKSGVVTHWGHGQWYDEPGEGHAQDPARPLTFRYLSENEVHTASVSGFSKRHLAYHFGAAFRESIQPAAHTGHEDASGVTETAKTWLDDHGTEDDWFLHVNYWDVHHPYLGVDDLRDPVAETGPAAAWPDQDAIDAQQGMSGTRCAALWKNPGQIDEDAFREAYGEGWPERIRRRSDVEYILDGYDAAIRHVDGFVDDLLAHLEQLGVRDETAVVITGDHGEALGEHGLYADHAMAHPPCQRIPMVVSWPGVTDDVAGAVTDGKVYQFDLLATLCDLFDLPVPAGWDAEPFTGGLRDPDGFEGRDRLVCGHGIYTMSRAVYEGDWVYVRLLHPGVFSLPGLYNDPDLPNGGLELLHDRDADPHMTENLVGDEAYADTLEHFRGVLDGWVAEQTLTEDAGGEDPLARTAVETGPFLYADPEDLLEFYRESGYGERQIAAVARARDFPADD